MEEKDTKAISFKDIGTLIKSNLILVISIIIISGLLGCLYALFIQPVEFTATTLLEVRYKESDVEGEFTESEKGKSDSSIYSFARYLPKGYEVLFTSPSYVKSYNENELNVNNPLYGSLYFNIDEDLDVLFTVSYTYSKRCSGQEFIDTKNLVAETLDKYIAEAIQKVNEDDASVYANRLAVVSKAADSTVSTDKGMLKIGIIATLIGVIIAFVVLIIKHLLDETVGEKEDVEELTGTTVIAFIPLVQLEKDGAKKSKS